MLLLFFDTINIKNVTYFYTLPLDAYIRLLCQFVTWMDSSLTSFYEISVACVADLKTFKFIAQDILSLQQRNNKLFMLMECKF